VGLFVLCGLLVGGVPGCGDLGNTGGARANTARLVTDEQLQRYGRESPERAFLTWFRDIQRGDAGGAATFYAKSLRVDAGQVAVDRLLANGLFAVLGPPRILYRVGEGDTVTIYTMLPKERVAPNGRRDVLRRPYAFHLERIDGAWKLTDNLFLEIAAEAPRRGAAKDGS
jgi:hypothetical protein